MLRRDWRIAATLALGTVVVAWGITIAAGLVGVPRTDDWGFAREAYSLHAGHLRLINWGPMTKIGLLLWAQPFLWVFGDHHWALALSVSVLMTAGLVAVYSLARRRSAPLAATAVVGCVLLFPGVVRDTASFMTDPAALALQLMTLALGAAAVEAAGRRQSLLFAASMVAGLWAFSIRELALAAPLAVIVAAVITAEDPRWRRSVLGAGGAFVVLAGGVWWWHHGLTGVEAYRGHPKLVDSAVLVVSCAITVALALAPALALSLPRWWSSRHVVGRLVGAAIGAAVVALRPLLAWHLGVKNWWLVGDYLQADGINGGKMMIGYRPTVLTPPIWHVLIAFAVLSTVLCSMLLGEWAAQWCTRAGRHRRNSDPVAGMVGWHAAFASGVLVVAAVWNGALFDRYTWSLVVSGSWLLLCRRGPASVPQRTAAARQVVGTLAIVLAGATTVLLTVNSAAFDHARWSAATAQVAAGTPAAEIDGGIEWDGYHSSSVDQDGLPAINDPLVSWWSHMTAMPKVCIVVTASPVASPLGEEIATYVWKPWLVGGRSTLHIYRLHAPACP
jgi:hypothetical protein